ncbi:cystathionine beta-lyase [Agrobacterium sp. rho-13.3]|uniref:cystathionine beta-lyase n=1 Tax=Agrobacterium sp. rho-13.3 TaxID=3072980 RepID=UPI002A15F9D0|nr:cystathionine beta-lyase [Agrobacterium sp. rho-13.3]MDX8311408.1 cystathionine beta-lyase [Agrobacterium sp. rho-13.3]
MSNKDGIFSDAGINTQLTHLGNDPAGNHGFVNPPIMRGSTVLFPDAETLVTEKQKYTYGTHGTPTTDALCEVVNQLEGSAGTILLPSGLAAVTVPFLAYLSAGDHALIVDSVYFPSRRFCNTMLKQYGIEVEYYDPAIGAGIEALIRPNTRLIHLEAPGSNTFEMQDVRLISSIAHTYDCVVTMDNTWATPLYFKPLEHGVDVSIHAATKYPAGHSDVLMGFVSANEKHWKKLNDANRDLGLCVTSDDAYQVLRGLRTMGVRLEHHRKSALEIAQWLESRDDVAQVLHPALPSFPSHDIWKRDFKGSTGVFSFVLKAEPNTFKQKSHAFLDALSIFGLGFSWGGYESLAVLVSLRDRVVAKGPTEGPIIRLQIGLEDVADLKRDLEAGFAAAAAVA